MSRSGYSDDCEYIGLYRAAVDRALHGKRGQAFLRELAASLDAMPEKILIQGELVNYHGEVCAIGAVCQFRLLDLSRIDYEDMKTVARLIGVSLSMAAAIAYMNDECGKLSELPSERWARIRKWVADNLATQPTQ